MSTLSSQDWTKISTEQRCPFTKTKCYKIRKSDPSTSIGTCTVRHGRARETLIICPNRFLGNGGQVFTDSLHLLTRHEPGNQLYLIPEVSIPGGTVDFFLVSAKGASAVDFVGIELQGLDTTGTVWPHRQAFLASKSVPVTVAENKSMGINWKMTAKTILVQLHHKVETFEAVGRRLVLVLQQELLDYMAKEFSFDHLEEPRLDNSMHFHPYGLLETDHSISLELLRRRSTSTEGIGKALSLRKSAIVELTVILAKLESKIGPDTRFNPVQSCSAPSPDRIPPSLP